VHQTEAAQNLKGNSGRAESQSVNVVQSQVWEELEHQLEHLTDTRKLESLDTLELLPTPTTKY